MEELEDFRIHMREVCRRANSNPEPLNFWARFLNGLRNFTLQPLPVAAAICAVALIFAVPAIKTSFEGPAQTLELQSLRGGTAAQTVSANHKLELKLNVDGLSPSESYKVAIVDANGTSVFTSNAKIEGGQLQVSTPALKKGTYFVRIYAPSSQLLREFLLQAT